MIYSKISLSETSLIAPIVKDYLRQENFLKPFYNEFNSLDSYKKIISSRNFDDSKRPVLIDGLMKQYGELGYTSEANPLLFSNISSLKNPNTFTITTGHQLCLFGGPLFLTYKVLTAIKLCFELQKTYPEQNFVPVLWLASEDHDFEEINSIHLFGNDFKWYKNSENKPVGILDLDGLKEDIEGISKLIGNNQTGQKWIKLLEQSYLDSKNLSEASIKIFTQIFSDFGLIVLDPNQREFKLQFRKVMQDDILNQCSYTAQKTADEKLGENYKLQINAREINFFYIDPSSGRKMIRKAEGGFSLADSDRRFSAQEMANEIEEFPERFSPNVNLRPLFEENILPNLAYVGGPAEVAYWLQLKPVFDYYSIPFPVVVLRSMNLLIGKSFLEKIEKTGLPIEKFLGSDTDISEAYLELGKKLEVRESFDLILNEFQKIVDATRDIDKDISKGFLETKLSMKDFFHQKNKDLKKSIENAEAIQIEKVQKLRSKLFPKDVFQERIDTLMQHEVVLDQSLIRLLFDEMEVFEDKLTVYSL